MRGAGEAGGAGEVKGAGGAEGAGGGLAICDMFEWRDRSSRRAVPVVVLVCLLSLLPGGEALPDIIKIGGQGGDVEQEEEH